MVHAWQVLSSDAIPFSQAQSAAEAATAKDTQKSAGVLAPGTWRLPTATEVTEAIAESADGSQLHFRFSAELRSLWTDEGKVFNLDADEIAAVPDANAVAQVAVVREGVVGPAAPVKRRFAVSGYMDSAIFQQCVEAAQYLAREYDAEYEVDVVREYAFEFEKNRSLLVSKGVSGVEGNARVLVRNKDDGTIVSGEQFIRDICTATDFRIFDVAESDEQSYLRLAQRSFMDFLRCKKSEFCWITVRIGDQLAGRIVFQLYSDLCPRTCENFLHLCKGDLPDAVDPKTGKKVKLSYKGTTFFRVVAGGWIQGGDVAGAGGTDGHSIYGRRFPDECFTVAHDQAGILGMANEGEHTNNSQFYVTLAKAGWMNRRYVAFGRVVEGLQVMEAIGNAETRHNQTPRVPITIDDCGHIQLH